MNVKQLIEKLQPMPQDAKVVHLWDGAARTTIEHVWLARNGEVVTADYGEFCYSTETRPLDAPDEEQQWHWATPAKPQDGEKTMMEDKLIAAGVKNLHAFGYPDCDKDNILTDQIYRAFFASILKDNKGKAGDAVDKAIDSLLAKCGDA